MDFTTIIATHAIAFSVLAGLALPVVTARLILAFDRRPARLVLPSRATALRQAQPRSPGSRRLPTLAVQFVGPPRLRASRSHATPGLAARWKGAHRLAVGA